MTLEQIIKEYVKTLQIPSARERSSICKMLLNFYENHWDINSDTQTLLANLDDFLNTTVDGIQSYKKDKNRLNLVLRRFIQFFRDYHNIKVDIETLFPPLKFREKSERMIDILKYLHEGSKTREEIAEHFGISERALSDDLNELQSGSYSFLGYRMNIDLKRGDNTYDSTIHPVFLPLNLSEVYALTIGLKMTGKGTAFEDVYNYIADCIFDQLSDYGQKRMAEKAGEKKLYFDAEPGKAYRYENDLLNEKLQQERHYLLAYYLKSGAPCEIEYATFEGIKTAVGRIDLAKDERGYAPHRIQIFQEGEKAIEIDLNKVLTIKLVNH